MGFKLLDGKLLSEKIICELKSEVITLKNKLQRVPGLAVILVGNDPASEIYVNNKKKACAEIGINSFEYLLSEKVTTKEIKALIEKLNQDQKINGILLQLPLPAGLDEYELLSYINPQKDVDGFHPENIGKLLIGLDTFISCTPLGIIMLLQQYQIETEGKNVVVLGRSNIVGKPIAAILMQKEFNATVTVCHSKTNNLKEVTSRADILIVAIGKPKFVTADFVKQDAIVIDVGMNRIIVDDGKTKLVGDVDFETVKEKTSFITPVPGGVGKLTIAGLMKNTLAAFKIQNGIN